MSEQNIIRSISEIFNGSYQFVIPLYQRNFAWGNEEIRKLISDIYDAYRNETPEYYLGTLTYYKRTDTHGIEKYEVVDGQQRLTALTLLSKLLGEHWTELCLEYDSRPEVTELLETFYKYGAEEVFNHGSEEYIKTGNYYEQLKFLCKDFSLDVREGNSNQHLTLDTLCGNGEFKKYFFERVKLVMTEVPAGMNVAQYFLIMNNRGEQLQAHEIVKAKLLGMLSSDDNSSNLRRICAQIWDACSIMNVRVQRSFDSGTRADWFGENYDSIFPVDEYVKKIVSGNAISSEKESAEDSVQSSSLDAIWKSQDSTSSNTHIETDSNEVPQDLTPSIIDFADFLMHVLKLEYGGSGVDIPLKADNLNSVFEALNKKNLIEPKRFFAALLRWRIIFDRFIVKPSENEELELKWKLHKPAKRITKEKNKEKNKEKITLSFENDSFNEPYQQEILKALSMLQVTYSPRDYKNYLQKVLSWFKDEAEAQKIIADPDGKEFLSRLNRYILRCFEALQQTQDGSLEPIFTPDQTETFYYGGTDTPHLLLNFIDYLYYEAAVHSDLDNLKAMMAKTVEHMKFSRSEDKDKFVKDFTNFEFRYRNSIEHHYAQSRASNAGKEALAEVQSSQAHDIGQKQCDCLGNLYLIGGSGNSVLGSKSPQQKAEDYIHKNVGPNRRIIIRTTLNKQVWGWEEISDHYQDLLALISLRKEILGCNDNI